MTTPARADSGRIVRSPGVLPTSFRPFLVAWILLGVVGCPIPEDPDDTRAPRIVDFQAEPASLPAGVQTLVTFTWSYEATPVPEPTCELDHYWPMESGDQGLITAQEGHTRHRLTCTNSVGSDTVELVFQLQ